MLRVLFLSSLFPHSARPYAGAFVERQILAFAKRRGVEAKVVSPLALPPFPLSLAERLRGIRTLPLIENWKGVEVYRPTYLLLKPLPSLAAGAMARRLLPLLRHIRQEFVFDLIDAQVLWPDGVAAQRLAHALGVPYSIKGRGEDVDYWGRRRSTRAMVRQAGEDADGLLAVSEGLRRNMIEAGLPPEKIQVHYTGLDRSAFQVRDRAATKARLGISGPFLLSVGNLISRKGHRYAIEAAALLPHVTLWIAGGGPHVQRLQALIAGLGLEERVRLLGHVPHAMLPSLMAAADATILASSEEGLANVWVESLACGTPVITTDVGGARELIDRPEAGRIVERDAGAIAAAVRDLLADPPGPEAVSAAAQRFSWESSAERLEAYYRELLGRRPRR